MKSGNQEYTIVNPKGKVRNDIKVVELDYLRRYMCVEHGGVTTEVDLNKTSHGCIWAFEFEGQIYHYSELTQSVEEPIDVECAMAR